MDHGLELAKAVGATIGIVTVTESWPAVAIAASVEAGARNPIEDYEQLAAQSAEEWLAAARRVADRVGIVCTTKHIPDRRPSKAIVETARDEECDLIVM